MRCRSFDAAMIDARKRRLGWAGQEIDRLAHAPCGRSMAKVLMAVGSPAARKEMKRLLESDPSLKQVCDVDCGEPVLDAAWEEEWNLVILGPRSPDLTSLDVLFHLV